MPAPLSIGLGAGCAVDGCLHRSKALLETIDTTIGCARMVRGISNAFPQLFSAYSGKPTTPIHLVHLALDALRLAGCYEDPDGWLWLLTDDLCYAEPTDAAECAATLGELAQGLTISTETSDIYEVGLNELPPRYQIIFALMGALDDGWDGEDQVFEDSPWLPLALATARSQSGLIFTEKDPFPWPDESPHWRAMSFFDASTGNDLVDLRSGTLDVSWDQLKLLADLIADARRYVAASFHYLDSIREEDPLADIVAWAGQLRRDLTKARADRRELPPSRLAP
jgi:hypothetical protein